MNKSKRIFVLLIAVLIAIPAFSLKSIKFHKSKWASATKSAPAGNPVEALLDDDNRQITLYFYQDLGQVNVKLSNQAGEIFYNEPVNTATTQEAEIYFDDPLPSGAYLLLITDGLNELLGVFSIE